MTDSLRCRTTHDCPDWIVQIGLSRLDCRLDFDWISTLSLASSESYRRDCCARSTGALTRRTWLDDISCVTKDSVEQSQTHSHQEMKMNEGASRMIGETESTVVVNTQQEVCVASSMCSPVAWQVHICIQFDSIP